MYLTTIYLYIVYTYVHIKSTSTIKKQKNKNDFRRVNVIIVMPRETADDGGPCAESRARTRYADRRTHPLAGPRVSPFGFPTHVPEPAAPSTRGSAYTKVIHTRARYLLLPVVPYYLI